jgi:phosphate-selective porin OprO/OprP
MPVSRRLLLCSLLIAGLLMSTVCLVTADPSANTEASVVRDILQLLRSKGYITETEHETLMRRLESSQDPSQPTAAPPAPKADQTTTPVSSPDKPRDVPIPPAKQSQPITAGIDQGKPYLASPDGRCRVDFTGRLHSDYVAVESDSRLLTGEPISDQFLIRRARLGIDSRFEHWIRFRLETELTESLSLKDVFLEFLLPGDIRLRAGQFWVPFSAEALTSSNFIDFMERSLLNEIVPPRDIGVMLHGQLSSRLITYAVGVFNGSGEDTADTSSGKDVAARLTVAPFASALRNLRSGVEIGANITWGDQGNFRTSQGRTTARASNRFRYFAPQTAHGERFRWGTDLFWHYGPASLKFEYDEERSERRNLAPVVARGWYLSGTYLLTGEEKVIYGPILPRRPFSPLTEEWGLGAWELAVRYATLAFDSDDPVDFFDGDVGNGITGGGFTATNQASAFTAGINWYLNSRTRFMMNWSTYWFDNPLGTPFSCRQPSCGAGQLRLSDETWWELSTRFQFWF